MSEHPWDRHLGAVKPRFIQDYEYEELCDLLSSMGLRESNARRLFTAVQRGIEDYDQLNPHKLSNLLLSWLDSSEAPPIRLFSEVAAHPSSDGSVKYVYTLYDGYKIESVYMPFGRYATLCISSQAGCALGCTFCATGALGFKRHLTAGEILGQVIHMRRTHLETEQSPERWNIVFMGMGEPLHNIAGVLKSFRLLTHPYGMNISPKDVAVSTSGLVPRIKELAAHKNRPRLMVSIAQTTDEKRSKIMPVNRAYPLEELLTTLEQFPLQKRERIMLSYVLIAGVNDSEDDALALINMSRRFPSIVNLIPMNAHEASPGMDEPEEEHLLHFARVLKNAGVFTTIRRSRGRDVAAACGQLAAV